MGVGKWVCGGVGVWMRGCMDVLVKVSMYFFVYIIQRATCENSAKSAKESMKKNLSDTLATQAPLEELLLVRM